MGRMPIDVMQHPLDLVWQSIFTWLSWGIVAVMLVVAVQMGRKQRTPFYVIAILAAGVGAYAEPLYDVAFDLWFYDAQAGGAPGAGYMHFSAFGVVQPIWTHSGYVILYATACLYAGRRIYEGRLGRRGLFTVWGIEIAASCLFEIIGTGTGVYTYYGPFVARIWNYPLVIGVLEGTQVVLFTVVAVLIWRQVSSAWGLLSLFVVFPMTFFAANFGVGAPVIIAMHLDGGHATVPVIWIATLATIGLCAVVVNGLSRFLPQTPVGPLPVDLPDRAPAGTSL
ncbi:hypothetical protein GCM10009645_54380 [Mycolicibacterium poriferae]|uniref:Uncharacterized protein n=1 Tax=Mycolicibacterium poriferae TaxID=39694 RepID=A0A6N4VBJ7_9MYCO|nr:hypothetical protein [Mycolicibacterium poriferae]MAS04708.1 hypothetical protein [Ahrensia sp.]MCV7262621.1 hypothetical protein [Mycolicibacterium poriferae]BBX53112.1 hypothetical protein MPOR_41380 [Mycolicibacterium poriferae]